MKLDSWDIQNLAFDIDRELAAIERPLRVKHQKQLFQSVEQVFGQDTLQELLVYAGSIKSRGKRFVRQREVVFLIHGILTHAEWQPMVQRALQGIPGVVVRPIKYGRLDLFCFWAPFLRRIPITDTRRQIQAGRAENQDARHSVIAHSFGTYAITKILDDNPDIKLQRLILCGSIIKRKFRWDHVRDRVVNTVVNEVGTRDIWPVMANLFSWDYGDTGRRGFARGATVQDRFHDFGHSDFLDEPFVLSFWKPWFCRCNLIDSRWNPPVEKWWFAFLTSLPVKSLAAIAVVVVGLIWYWF